MLLMFISHTIAKWSIFPIKLTLMVTLTRHASFYILQSSIKRHYNQRVILFGTDLQRPCDSISCSQHTDFTVELGPCLVRHWKSANVTIPQTGLSVPVITHSHSSYLMRNSLSGFCSFSVCLRGSVWLHLPGTPVQGVEDCYQLGSPPFCLSFSRLNKCSSLNVSSFVRCSSPLNVSVVLQ